MKFEIGQIVVLKSCGPRMVVTHHLTETGTFVRCCWFGAGEPELRKGDFVVEALEPVQET